MLKPNGSFFQNVGAAPANPLLPHELLLKLQPLFRLQNTLHWIKSITVQPRQGPEISAGHFKPINSKRFITDCHEYVFHLTKDGNVELDRLAVGVAYADKSNISRWNHTKEDARDLRCRGNNWFIPYKTINSRESDRPHPATFPAQLAEWCIRLHGLRPDLVMLEPFLGIGHAGAAAAACEVKKFIGFEIDEGYLTEARDRLGVAAIRLTANRFLSAHLHHPPIRLDARGAFLRRHAHLFPGATDARRPFCERAQYSRGDDETVAGAV